MKIDKYLSSMLPNFSKQRMLEDLNVMREELRENTLPPLQAIERSFGKRKWSSDWVKAFDEAFSKDTHIRYSGNFLTGMVQTMENVEKNMDVVERLIGEYYADDVLRDAMTILRVNLMQYLETMNFAIHYTRRLLVAAMSIEIKAVDQEATSEVLPGELSWLERGRSNYFTALHILSAKKEEVEKRFKELPEMTVTKDSVNNVVSVAGLSRVDPFQFGLIPVFLNPIYHIRMAIADWQVTRFKAAQEEKRMLEFKLLQLKMASSGKKDAKLEQQIEYTETRLQKLNYKLKDMEESYGTA
jgi:hypothetical protein